MRLISAGSLVRAQSGPFFARVISRERRLSRRSLGEGGPQCRTTWASYDSAIVDCGLLAERSKLKINKRHGTCRGKQFKHQKRANICRDLDTRRLQRQPIDELIAFLRDCQKQRNEKKYYRPGGQQEFNSYVLETEQRT